MSCRARIFSLFSMRYNRPGESNLSCALAGSKQLLSRVAHVIF